MGDHSPSGRVLTAFVQGKGGGPGEVGCDPTPLGEVVQLASSSQLCCGPPPPRGPLKYSVFGPAESKTPAPFSSWTAGPLPESFRKLGPHRDGWSDPPVQRPLEPKKFFFGDTLHQERYVLPVFFFDLSENETENVIFETP